MPGQGEGSNRRDTVHVQIGGIKRCRSANEQPVQLCATETDVSDQFRNFDLSDQRTVRRQAMNSVSGRGPDASISINAEPIEQPFGALGQNVAARQRAVVIYSMATNGFGPPGVWVIPVSAM